MLCRAAWIFSLGQSTSEAVAHNKKLRMPGVEPGSQAWEACMMPLHYMRFWTKQAKKHLQLFRLRRAAREKRQRCALPLGLRAWMESGGNPIFRLWGFLLRPAKAAELGKQAFIEKFERAVAEFFAPPQKCFSS